MDDRIPAFAYFRSAILSRVRVNASLEMWNLASRYAAAAVVPATAAAAVTAILSVSFSTNEFKGRA